MISVEENYKLVNDLLAKNNGVYLSPEEYERYFNMGSYGYFDNCIGRKASSPTVYGLNRTLDRRLMPFRVVTPLTVTNGVVTLPDDVVILTAVYTQDYIPLRQVDEDRLARLMQDPLADPQDQDPVLKEDEGTLRVYPENIPSVTIEYLKRPDPVKYGYTVVNKRAVFDPVTTQDSEWDKMEEQEITIRILQYCGVSMGNGEIVQYATMAKQQNE